MIEYTRDEVAQLLLLLKETLGADNYIEDNNSDPNITTKQIILRALRANVLYQGSLNPWGYVYCAVFEDHIDCMPLYINDKGLRRVIAKWRLKIGK